MSLALILNKNNSKKYNFIFYTTVKENISLFKEKKIDIQYIKITFLSRIQYLVKSSKVIRKFFNFIELKLDSTFKKDDIDLVYFLTQSSLRIFSPSRM